MKNVFIYVGLGLILVGGIIGSFTGIPAATWIELAGFAGGLAMCIASIIKKSDKKDWKVYVAIIGIVIGVMLLIWAGIAQDLVVSIITAVFGLMVLITSLLPVMIKSKNK